MTLLRVVLGRSALWPPKVLDGCPYCDIVTLSIPLKRCAPDRLGQDAGSHQTAAVIAGPSGWIGGVGERTGGPVSNSTADGESLFRPFGTGVRKRI
jgi:hypothetical protein